jgi:IS5 family transposase
MRWLDSQLTFAGLELQRLGVQLDPALQAVSDFLDQHASLIELVRQDLERGLKKPGSGRNGIAPSQALRSLILMRVKNWDYRELRERINDGVTLRGFTRFDGHRVPKHDAFNRAFTRLTAETLTAVNQAVVAAAVKLDLEDGKKLRVDTTVVETNIHFPTDATLLWDSVRTVSRLVDQLQQQLPWKPVVFPNRKRSARRRMQQIQRMTAQQRSQQQVPKYRELIAIAQQVIDDARRVVKTVEQKRKRNKTKLSIMASATVDQLRKEIGEHCQLAGRVIAQTRRRVLEGEQVPAEDKVYSIFEPHTDLIKRGKQQKPVELGHKVFLAESANGLITHYRVLDGNPADCTQVAESVARHQELFECVPELYAADRGFFSAGA